ncbi:MAG: hypothetical protein GT601_08065 [Acidaminobacter sp.]|uniref:S-layer homology domain-containing protein n=1 Tax=Acidaminobacter sp. TaxID=1872102 RepID=UPI0013865051|nr:S-layer homology domain-containing protein [Acidaminobacter sp.]MZQ97618.1 hypothetical protein [Acidaminobacter sp.]
MRLTNREKLLLIFLSFAIIGYLTFNYIVLKQWVSLDEKEFVLNDWQAKKIELETIDQSLAKLNSEWEVLDNDIQSIGNKYFSLIEEQEDLILLFNELLKTPGIKDLSINFEEPQAQELEGGSVKMQPVVLSYEGEYTSLWTLLKSIWKFDNRILISGLTMTKDETTLLTGQISMELHDLSEMTHSAENLVMWFNNDTFIKGNPFTPLPGEPFSGTRYLMKSESINTVQTAYVKFADIAGHWAESSIDNFGEKRLIYGDANNFFYPDSSLSRGELIILLDGLFEWPTPAQPVDLTKFSDYMELGRYESVMAKAIFKGFLSEYIIGYEDGTLRPNNPITYEEFDLVMQKVLQSPDFNWKSEAEKIQTITGHISKGIADENAFMTRAEAVYFLESMQ